MNVKTMLVIALIAALCPQVLKGESTVVEYKGQLLGVTGDYQEYISPDGDLIIRWLSGSGTLHVPNKFIARMLVVGGGGAGGYGTTSTTNPGGGGGGGEVVELPECEYVAGTYSIVIGSGGAQTTTQQNGEDGQSSTLSFAGSVIANALGGGGGGARASGNGGISVATGGGGSGSKKSGGTGKLYSGGLAVNTSYSGGGGGAGGNGADSTSAKAGDGGAGVSSDITGDANRYGGGGGGGQTSTTASLNGSGVDGGGTGGWRNNCGAAGTANTGGGGGGGGSRAAGCDGGAGGSGVVIIRITDVEEPIVWREIGITAAGGTGKIFVDEKADTKWVGDDLVIIYTNVSSRGGLRFFDPDNASLPPVWANARVLSVGGGGGGGMVSSRSYGGGAGGGAGGFVEQSGLVFDNTMEYSVAVGKGGAGGSFSEDVGVSGTSSSLTTNGENLIAVAFGGGGGGAHSAGVDGASGGGGSAYLISGEILRPGGAGIEGQGYMGGDGCATFSAGGGGGAGGAGTSASYERAGAGGIGKSSDITGELLWYAGGGGGWYVNDANLYSPHPGADGGSGVGGDGAGVEGGVPVPATDGAANTGSGGGGGISNEGASDECAGNGADGIVIIRLTGFIVSSVPVPTPQGPFTYDGNAHTGVVEHYSYRILSESKPVATNAGTYAVTVAISPDLPESVQWNDAIGGRGTRTIPWTILAPTYDLVIDKVEKGVVETSVTNNILAGTEVTISANPDAGYEVGFIRVNDSVIDGMTFAMPEKPVTLTVMFKRCQSPTTPGTYEPEEFVYAMSATNAASVINANKGDYIAAPAGAATTQAYLDLFEAVPTYDAGSGLYVVNVGLTAEAEETLREKASESITNAVTFVELISDSQTSANMTTIPGLYYTILGGTNVNDVTIGGTKTLATGSETEVPKPELKATGKAFYRISVSEK